MSGTTVDLSRSHLGEYTHGRSFIVRAVWVLVEAAVFQNPFVTSYVLKRAVLRAFGARVGRRVLIKPGVHIKHPWRLVIGDNSWIGERAWIDNLASVEIGANCCVSQGAYLCTGNHDWSSSAMTLFARPIHVGDGAWVGARAIVGPGARIGQNAVVALGSVVTGEVGSSAIVGGNPPHVRGVRRLNRP